MCLKCAKLILSCKKYSFSCQKLVAVVGMKQKFWLQNIKNSFLFFFFLSERGFISISMLFVKTSDRNIEELSR